jgi:hypothetical protein
MIVVECRLCGNLVVQIAVLSKYATLRQEPAADGV